MGKVVDGQPLQSNTWCLVACKDLAGCANVPVCEIAAEGEEPAPSPCLACLAKDPAQIPDEYCFNQCAYGDGISCVLRCTNEYGANPAARDEAVQNAANTALADCVSCVSDGVAGSQSDATCNTGCRNNVTAFGLDTAQAGCGQVDPSWGCVWTP